MYRISIARFPLALSLALLVGHRSSGRGGGLRRSCPLAPSSSSTPLNPNPQPQRPQPQRPQPPNALNPNALNPNTLSPAALTAIQDPGAAGDLSRQLLLQLYGRLCAFLPSQSFDSAYRWTDGSGTVHNEEYRGDHRPRAGRSTKPLGVPEQQWISACLASRTNWYGVSVTISSRGTPSAIDKTGTLRGSRPTRIWKAPSGAICFPPSPYLNACYDEANRSHSRSLMRDCAAGHLTSGGAVQQADDQHPRVVHRLRQQLNMNGMYYPSCVNNLTGIPSRPPGWITRLSSSAEGDGEPRPRGLPLVERTFFREQEATQTRSGVQLRIGGVFRRVDSACRVLRCTRRRARRTGGPGRWCAGLR